MQVMGNIGVRITGDHSTPRSPLPITPKDERVQRGRADIPGIGRGINAGHCHATPALGRHPSRRDHHCPGRDQTRADGRVTVLHATLPLLLGVHDDGVHCGRDQPTLARGDIAQSRYGNYLLKNNTWERELNPGLSVVVACNAGAV
uniref:Uncharacterized protein n=1 Tax=Timema bartmani TaxID=61472 RepID=A0A7R9FB24_9NEOP|nr:unnamed protein product [Timema bartmani]